LRLVRELAAKLVREPLALPRAFRCAPERGYGRNLLHLDREQQFVVIAMIWPPHSGSAAHDHGTWGVVAVTEGEVDVTNFEREDDGRDPSRARLRAACTLRAAPGAVASVLPPHEDFHSVYNPSDSRTAVTIHTYGCEPFNFHRVELASGAVTLGRLAYDNLRES
jgi:predicted metal-dependent enzyme (double-stranded beta helix superfamily)